MIKKIKNYFIKLYNDLSCTYIPYFKVFFINILIFIISLFVGVFIGRLTIVNNNENTSVSLSSDSEIIVEDKEYFLIPMLPYTNNNNYFDFSQGNFIISYNTQHIGYLDIVYPTTANDNLIYEQTLIGTNYYLDIAMQSQNIGYYSEMYTKQFRIVLSYDTADWLYNYDRISRYGYFYDVGTGLNYNTVYNFYQGDNIIGKIYFMDTDIIPYFDYTNITNLVFTTDKVSSFNLDDLVDTSYYNGYQNGRSEGIEIGRQQGYNQGYREAKEYWEDIGYSNGLQDGEQIGYDKGVEEAWNEASPTEAISHGLTSFLGIEIFRDFTLGHIVIIAIVLAFMPVAFRLFGWI